MKIPLFLTAGIFSASSLLAQQVPGAPEENGLTPKTETTYVNRQTADITTLNNNSTESLGIAIANGGNVLIGWEDDGDEIQDLEGVWTMFDSAGVSITPALGQTATAFPGQSLTNNFLSYFRADKSALPGATSWGPKIHANQFGDGVGFGATSFGLGEEITDLSSYAGTGDFPSVQLLDNAGQPVRIVTGLDTAYAARDGDIRIGDWEYLSNGNIVIVGESRQDQDLVDVYQGAEPAHHAIFRIVDGTGKAVVPETLVSDTPIKSEIWHGAAATANGFAVRFSGPGGATVRMFDNAGKPVSTNLDLATLSGHPEAGGGGRGDGSGFHGNGKDAYVHVAASGSEIWVTVLSTNGTVRYSKSVADDLTLASAGRADAAIDADGNVIVVFEAKYNADSPATIMGRRFDSTGKPLGGSFYVSEKEAPGLATGASAGPRVAWRNGQVAVAWESNNDIETIDSETGLPKTVVAFRLFSTFNPGSLESLGLTRIVPDTPIIKPAADALGNWEPYASVLGNSVFLVEGNTFADGSTENQRYVVALQPVAGGAMKQVEGFYTDNGQPFKGQINLSRQNGNPGRVAGDTRPGAVNYVVGGEASPHAIPEFQSNNRWNLGFDRLADGRYGTIEFFKLDTATLTPTPLTKALDSANGRLTSGDPQGNNQITRFGGDMVGLDNGNFVSVVEDRSKVLNPDGNAAVATIFAPDGTVVKESFVVANGDIWANVAPFKGGFAVRASGIIYFFDNTGKTNGSVNQATSGATFDAGRGDGTRIFGHINSPYVYLTGKAANTTIVKVAVFDSRTQKFVTIADVSEGGFTGNFDRANGAVDALDRLVVSWVVQPAGYAQQQVAARVLAFDGTSQKVTPLTPSFFAFQNTATNNIRTLQMSVAMTTRQICIAAKGEINYANKPDAGPDSPREVNFFTVFSHPAPKDDPTTPAGGGGQTGGISISSFAASAGKLNVTWTGGTGPFTVQKKTTLTDANWVDVTTSATTSAALDISGATGFFRVVGK